MSEIDVSKCCCYENGKCLWTKRYYENNIVPDCEKVKDCYYKQLQQSKAENEDLTKQILKQANAKIQLDKLNEKFGKDYCNIKQCLYEIEKICTHETINLTNSCVNGWRYFEILQKIKEVKGENE